MRFTNAIPEAGLAVTRVEVLSVFQRIDAGTLEINENDGCRKKSFRDIDYPC